MSATWRGRLAERLGEAVAFDVPLAPRVAFRIGGPADALVRPRTAAELAATLELVDAEGLPLTVLGTGSNVLVRDGGIRGVVLRLAGELADFWIDPPRDGRASIRVGAGALNAPLVAAALGRSLLGLEFLATIPGTFGGALIMNAGAHGGEIGGFVRSVRLLDAERRERERPAADCGFVYRGSAFAPGELLLSAVLELPVASPEAIEAARAHLTELRARRRRTQPIGQPNAGSIFKNPPGDHAGRLIEACGLKGRRVGGAAISPLHANFIVNEGGATARDVEALAELARSAVEARFGVSLEWEVKRIGDFRRDPEGIEQSTDGEALVDRSDPQPDRNLT